MSTTAPHPGLAAAIVLAGSKRALARIIGKHHNYITYRMARGRGLKPEQAMAAGAALGMEPATLMDKKWKTQK